MSDLMLSLKTSETSLAVLKLYDDGSNWADYESTIQKAMEAKGIWKYFKGKPFKPMQYTEVAGIYMLADGKTPATEEQVEAKEAKMDEYD